MLEIGHIGFVSAESRQFSRHHQPALVSASHRRTTVGNGPTSSMVWNRPCAQALGPAILNCERSAMVVQSFSPLNRDRLVPLGSCLSGRSAGTCGRGQVLPGEESNVFFDFSTTCCAWQPSDSSTSAVATSVPREAVISLSTVSNRALLQKAAHSTPRRRAARAITQLSESRQ